MREIEDEFIKGRRREWRISKAFEQRSAKPEASIKTVKKEDTASRKQGDVSKKGKQGGLPEGCVDIIVEDHEAEEVERTLENER